jgi:hypothetical protein
MKDVVIDVDLVGEGFFMSQATDVADLLRKAGNAQTSQERDGFIRQAEELKSAYHTAAFGSGDWSAEGAKVTDNLVPSGVHELLRTASIDTDWITDLNTQFDSKLASQEMVAEASLWYGRASDDAKAYKDEYDEQAKNIARKLAGKYGDTAEVAEKAFLDEAQRLRTTAVRAGFVVEAGDAGEAPEESKSPAQKKFESTVEKRLDDNKDGQNAEKDRFKAASYEDNAVEEQDKKNEPDELKTVGMQRAAAYQQGAYDLFDFLAATQPDQPQSGNPGVYNEDPAAVSSNRAPVFQELQSGSSDVVTPNDPGLGQTDDLTGANQNQNSPDDHASKRPFPVQGTKKESNMQYATCRSCGGHGKVAMQQREAASGLPQIDQIVDNHDNGPQPTPYPTDVAFPWTMNPQVDVANSVAQAESQIDQRNSLSPLQNQNGKQGPARQSVQSARYTAGGRDNSGWMGDNGARGVDYPGEQVGQYPQPSTSEGYVDPVYGQGGDHGSDQPVKPYGAQEASDRTNKPSQWQPGMPTQLDQGWRETVAQDPGLQAAAAYIEQRKQAFLRASQG